MRTNNASVERRAKSWTVLDGKATGQFESRLACADSTSLNTTLMGLGFRMGGTAAAPTGYAIMLYLDPSGNVQLRFVKFLSSTTGTTIKTTALASGVLQPNVTYEVVLTVPATNIFSASIYAASDQLRASPLATLTLDAAEVDAATFASGWWVALGRSVSFHAWGEFRWTEL